MIIQLIPLFRIIQNSSQVDYSEFQIIPGLASLCPHSVRPSVTVFYYMKKMAVYVHLFSRSNVCSDMACFYHVLESAYFLCCPGCNL